MGITVGRAEDEKGRELLAHELTERMVVILHKEGSQYAATIWVKWVYSDYIAFLAGVTGMVLLCKRNPDGTLEDDSKTRVRVYEYLGEI